MPDVSTIEIDVAVAVSGAGQVYACPYCPHHVQVHARYSAWHNEMRAKGCVVSIIRADVAVPEPVVTPTSVRAV